MNEPTVSHRLPPSPGGGPSVCVSPVGRHGDTHTAPPSPRTAGRKSLDCNAQLHNKCIITWCACQCHQTQSDNQQLF